LATISERNALIGAAFAVVLLVGVLLVFSVIYAGLANRAFSGRPAATGD
jgi:hypothetical protein